MHKNASELLLSRARKIATDIDTGRSRVVAVARAIKKLAGETVVVDGTAGANDEYRARQQQLKAEQVARLSQPDPTMQGIRVVGSNGANAAYRAQQQAQVQAQRAARGLPAAPQAARPVAPAPAAQAVAPAPQVVQNAPAASWGVTMPPQVQAQKPAPAATPARAATATPAGRPSSAPAVVQRPAQAQNQPVVASTARR